MASLSAKPTTTTTFKVSLWNSGETRRFGATRTFRELKERLAEAWGNHPFVFTYRDEDDDVITFGDEPGFREALEVANDLGLKVLKLQAFKNESDFKQQVRDQPQQQARGAFHSEVPPFARVLFGPGLADLLANQQRSCPFANKPAASCGGGGGGGGCCKGGDIPAARKNLFEHFKRMQQAQSAENAPAHPLGALFGVLNQALSQEPKAVHFGIACDKSNMCPIIGTRYTIEGANYDLCEEEFEKLPESERVLYSKIEFPGHTPVPCMSPKKKEDEEEEQTKKSDDEKKASQAAEEKPAEEQPKPEPEVAVEKEEDSKFADQLVELASMGFVDRDVNLKLLERYQGRVERVVNYIVEFQSN